MSPKAPHRATSPPIIACRPGLALQLKMPAKLGKSRGHNVDLCVWDRVRADPRSAPIIIGEGMPVALDTRAGHRTRRATDQQFPRFGIRANRPVIGIASTKRVFASHHETG